MKIRLFALLLIALPALAPAADKKASNAKPLRALLVTGGCCHDYELQAKALTEGSQKLAAVTWTVVNEGGKTTQAQIPLYDNPNWAKNYDVVCLLYTSPSPRD